MEREIKELRLKHSNEIAEKEKYIQSIKLSLNDKDRKIEQVEAYLS